MGLDMYLTKKTYIKNWDYMKPAEKHEISIKRGGKERTDIKPERVSEIEEEIMYWRKVNAIHAWFVKNVQEGEDDCKSYCVEYEQLKELRDTIRKVLKNHDLAEELLPTQVGFFFGGEAYDDYYFSELERTEKVLSEIIKDQRHFGGDFYYQSSW